MPITQNRMLNLAYAARDYQQGLRDLIRVISLTHVAIKEQRIKVEDAFEQISVYANEAALLEYNIKSSDTINMEIRYLETNQGRNERAKERQRLLRSGMGVKPRHGSSLMRKGKAAPNRLVAERELTMARRSTAPDTVLPTTESNSTIIRHVEERLQTKQERMQAFQPTGVDMSLPATRLDKETLEKIDKEAEMALKEIEYERRRNPDGSINVDDLAPPESEPMAGPTIIDEEMEQDQEGIELPEGPNGSD